MANPRQSRRIMLPTLAASSAAAVAAGLLALSPSGGASAQPRPGTGPAAAPFEIKTISSGWNFPWATSWLPDGSALVTERDSFQVSRLTQSGTRTRIPVAPSLAAAEKAGGDLLGIAVSPNWSRDHHVYVYHGVKEGNRIARMTYDGSTLSNYKVLVTGIKRGLHEGGRLKFGPDGYLYATTGDADTASDAQDKKSLNGKILRMTGDGKPAPGNPFGNLVYSYGHRNPQGITWDAEGRLWETEIGHNKWDELNLIRAGKNFGWPTCEGRCSTTGLENPARQWRPREGGVPSGLTYTEGALYVTSLKGQRLWRIPVTGSTLGTSVAHYVGEYGRLRSVEKVPGKRALWITTDRAGKDADRVLQVELG
ncbi:PQQ-dependent sugar dehydrogenase [Streptomyces sp. NPDC051219]|uniref:PQQ-dependent sugar dehydrogenase n=1 Tax=Streptomyces sp. NPDC051219 TaxID=3155283 RepID=UPI00343A04E8